MVSYKSIGINTFNCFVLSLESQLIKYWNESYQLWESPVLGFLLESNDFMVLDKTGVSLISLGERKSRVIVDSEGFERMLHPLGKCNYLKIEPTNHILFAFQFYDDRQICIQEQYTNEERFTKFEEIFKIKVHEITLRELCLL